MIQNFRTNKVVLITWSSEGLGKDIALYFAKKGAKVIINGKDKKALQEAAKNINDEETNIIAIQADLTQVYECEEMINSIIKTHKKIDVLVNSLSIVTRWLFEDTTIESLQNIINTNLMSTIYVTKYALPHIKQTKGSIISILGIWAYKGIPNMASYCWSKVAIVWLMEWINEEVKKEGVHIWLVVFDDIAAKKTDSTNSEKLIDSRQRQSTKNWQLATAIEECIQTKKTRVLVSRQVKLFLFTKKRAPILEKRIMKKKLKQYTKHLSPESRETTTAQRPNKN